MGEQPNPKRTDLTPLVSSQTDIAPLGRAGAKPFHERTADEDADIVDWNRIASDPEFLSLLKAKRRFIVPAVVFFVAYYFALPVLVGYYPVLMSTRVGGPVNIAYLFALSQFFMSWILAWLYVRAAARFDTKASAIISKYRARPTR